MKKTFNNIILCITIIIIVILIVIATIIGLYKKGYNKGYNECKRELEDKYSHPVERIVIDTLYLTRDSIIYKTKYIKQIEHDTIEKVYNLDTDGTLNLFYKLVSE